MKILRALTPEQLARAEERLRHPAPGSRIEAAGRYGVDLTLLVEQLRLTPAERARKLEMASEALGPLRGIAGETRRGPGKDLSALPELESLLESGDS